MTTDYNPKLLHLKVKIKALATEARIIRHEERKLKARTVEEKAYRRAVRLHAQGKGPLPVLKGKPQSDETKQRKCRQRLSLKEHRHSVVGTEARHSLLAYAFWRSRPYAEVEASGTTDPPDWDRVEKIAARFGRITLNPSLWIAWRQAAEAYLKQVRPAA